MISSDDETGEEAGAHYPMPPPPSLQYLADKLTLFQRGRLDYPKLLLLAAQIFFTFLHYWYDHHCKNKNWNLFPYKYIFLDFLKVWATHVC